MSEKFGGVHFGFRDGHGRRRFSGCWYVSLLRSLRLRRGYDGCGRRGRGQRGVFGCKGSSR
jgi:hypothetical protein